MTSKVLFGLVAAGFLGWIPQAFSSTCSTQQQMLREKILRAESNGNYCQAAGLRHALRSVETGCEKSSVRDRGTRSDDKTSPPSRADN